MALPNIQNETLPASIPALDSNPGQQTYSMSRQGRRQAILLLLGVASIWIFALWSLITILQDGVNGVEWVSLLLMLGMLLIAPLVAWTLLEEANASIVTTGKGIEYHSIAGITLTYNWEELDGFKPKQSKSRIASFFLGDNNEQASKAEATNPQHGGKETTYEQSGTAATAMAMASAKTEDAPLPDNASNTEDEDEDEPETLLLNVPPDRTNQIANPLSRFLHNQAHSSSLPIYGNLENRAQLLREIALHMQKHDA